MTQTHRTLYDSDGHLPSAQETPAHPSPSDSGNCCALILVSGVHPTQNLYTRDAVKANEQSHHVLPSFSSRHYNTVQTAHSNPLLSSSHPHKTAPSL